MLASSKPQQPHLTEKTDGADQGHCPAIKTHLTHKSTINVLKQLLNTVKMKSAAFAFTFVAAVAAQDIAALAQCGQTCANNMIAAGKAQELGCKEGDTKCLCSNPNFAYGLRDCSRAICSEQDVNQVIEYGVKYCEGAGVVITGGSGGPSQTGSNGEATQTGSNGAGASHTGSNSGEASHSATGGGEATQSGESGSGAKVTTLYSTETGTDGKVITTPVATSTIEGGNSGNGDASGSVLTYTTNGSQVVTTLATAVSSPTGTESSGATETGSGSESSTVGSGSESSTGGSGSESTSEGNGGASQTSEGGAGSQTTSNGGAATSTSKGLAAQITAAPGILAAAGLAALLI
ncbi:CFEM domain containing protein [Metarhizium anisopliae]|nr:CFEM domain containing protein [Metarhizium anisopliae]